MKRCMQGILMSSLFFVNSVHAQFTDWTMKFLVNDTQVMEIVDVRSRSIASDTLYYLHRGNQRTVPVDAIMFLSRSGGDGNLVRSVAIGAVGFGGAGFIAGQILGRNDAGDNHGYYSSSSQDKSDPKMILPVAGVTVGTVLGLALAPKSESMNYNLTMLKEKEKLTLLESLTRGSAGMQSSERMQKGGTAGDVVYLKNGSIIRGTLLEIIPDSIVKMETADNNLFIFKMSEVERITKEKPNNAKSANSIATDVGDYEYEPRFRGSVAIGFGMPVGSFNQSYGTTLLAPKSGFAVRGELGYPINPVVRWTNSVTASFNSLDVPTEASGQVGSWSSVFVLTGLLLGSNVDHPINVFADAQMGLCFGTNPELTATDGTIGSVSATAFGFGFSGGIVAINRITFSLSYLHSEPEFKVPVSGTINGVRQSGEGKFSQAINLFAITVGVAI